MATASRRARCTLVLSVALAALAASPAGAITATVVDVRKIADDAPHSAFTDLIQWRDRLVCAFRQGRGHVSSDGRIAVLSSADGETWEKTAELQLDGFDLRDASLSETPDGQLMLLGGAAPRPADGASAPTGTFASFTHDGRRWSTPEVIIPPGRWLWRVTWRDGQAYGVSYATPNDRPTASLLASRDGRQFAPLVPRLLDDGRPTEAVIRFAPGGTAYCLQRRDGDAPANTALLGMADPPYEQWSWHDLGAFFGGPNLIRTPVGAWIAAGRMLQDGGPKTVVAALGVDAAKLPPL
ncbi:MAG TPA: sialidase family protein, partial [Lacipirellulaceae bacterium]|nr:sialidase family protein [Lacipirellulaceae bacterium]